MALKVAVLISLMLQVQGFCPRLSDSVAIHNHDAQLLRHYRGRMQFKNVTASGIGLEHLILTWSRPLWADLPLPGPLCMYELLVTQNASSSGPELSSNRTAFAAMTTSPTDYQHAGNFSTYYISSGSTTVMISGLTQHSVARVQLSACYYEDIAFTCVPLSSVTALVGKSSDGKCSADERPDSHYKTSDGSCYSCPCDVTLSDGNCRVDNATGQPFCTECKAGYSGRLCRKCSVGYWEDKIWAVERGTGPCKPCLCGDFASSLHPCVNHSSALKDEICGKQRGAYLPDDEDSFSSGEGSGKGMPNWVGPLDSGFLVPSTATGPSLVEPSPRDKGVEVGSTASLIRTTTLDQLKLKKTSTPRATSLNGIHQRTSNGPRTASYIAGEVLAAAAIAILTFMVLVTAVLLYLMYQRVRRARLVAMIRRQLLLELEAVAADYVSLTLLTERPWSPRPGDLPENFDLEDVRQAYLSYVTSTMNRR